VSPLGERFRELDRATAYFRSLGRDDPGAPAAWDAVEQLVEQLHGDPRDTAPSWSEHSQDHTEPLDPAVALVPDTAAERPPGQRPGGRRQAAQEAAQLPQLVVVVGQPAGGADVPVAGPEQVDARLEGAVARREREVVAQAAAQSARTSAGAYSRSPGSPLGRVRGSRAASTRRSAGVDGPKPREPR